jgi:hypothetical protein
MTHQFTIDIGDWSDDGHGKKNTFTFAANKPIEDVREAYFAAKKRLKKLCPESFCNGYEDRHIPDEIYNALTDAGCPLPAGDPESIDTKGMALIVAWFCMQGNADLLVVPCEPVPSLAFYGQDAKRRHIGFFGYGLFD